MSIDQNYVNSITVSNYEGDLPKGTVWENNKQYFLDTFEEWEKVKVTEHGRTAAALIAEKPKSIIEFGSGSGILYKALLQKGYTGKYQGIDLTKEFINYCNDMYGDGLFKCGDLRTMRIKGKYDIGIMQDVLRHNIIKDRWIILNNIIPCIKKKLILAEPLGQEDISRKVQAVINNKSSQQQWNGHQLLFPDGTINLVNLMNHIQTIKHVKEFATVARNLEGWETDKRVGMEPSFIIIRFEEE